MARRRLRGVWLGRQRYETVHRLQLELHEARRAGTAPDTVLLVEHEPVITLGRGANARHLLAGAAELSRLGVDLVETGRGGDITLHAPGQLVCYPIVDLNPDRRDVRRYVQDLTRCMAKLASLYGVDAGTLHDYVGLWANRSTPEHWPGEEAADTKVKLGAIGVRISRWVTMHGFAFNLTTDLDLFRLIVPCGISQFGVSSIADLTGKLPSVRQAATQGLEILAEILEADLEQLETRTSPPLGRSLLSP